MVCEVRGLAKKYALPVRVRVAEQSALLKEPTRARKTVGGLKRITRFRRRVV